MGAEPGSRRPRASGDRGAGGEEFGKVIRLADFVARTPKRRAVLDTISS
jgi:hypothetical protein